MEAVKALDDFQTTGPFSSASSPKDALAMIAEMRAQLNALKEQEAQIRRGLGIFKIDCPLSKELQTLEKVCF